MTTVRVKTKDGKEQDVTVNESPLNVQIAVKKALLHLELHEQEVASARINPRD